MGLPDLLTSGLLLPLQGGEAVRLSETKEETVEARNQVGNLQLVEALTLFVEILSHFFHFVFHSAKTV